MLVAVPSEHPGGIDAAVSEHFGHCDAFTLVNLEEGEIGEVTVLRNQGHEHGGCMAPVMFLKSHNVDALIAGGMGVRPLAGFQQVGITVYFKEEANTVRNAVQLLTDGKCRVFGEAQTCGGGGGECGGHGEDPHHDQPSESTTRNPIEGVADIRDDRVVTLRYTLTATNGSPIASSDDAGPMRYLHGHSNIPPGLEKALTGLVAGAHKVVELCAAAAFGTRDDSRIISVSRDQLPDNAEVGGVVRARQADGTVTALTIVELSADSARLDPHHPLAGKDVVFDVTVVSVESATAEELSHGHVH